jgi:hypothetical protein
MPFEDIVARLIGLGLVTLIAVAVLVWLMRVSGHQAQDLRLLEGYPAELFSDREAITLPALQALCASQQRLLSVYRRLSPGSEMAIWLVTFLYELRAIMDTAYRAAVIGRVYDDTTALDTLSAEVAQIEHDVAGQITRRLLLGEDDLSYEQLQVRLAAMRLCARRLATSMA